jgi:hypothetical protein
VSTSSASVYDCRRASRRSFRCDWSVNTGFGDDYKIYAGEAFARKRYGYWYVRLSDY